MKVARKEQGRYGRKDRLNNYRQEKPGEINLRQVGSCG